MQSILLSTQEYNKMRSIKYRILLGFKGKISSFELAFTIKQFKHLIGLHYMENIATTKNSERLLKMILSGEISDEKVREHPNFELIKPRIDIVSHLEQYMDSDLTYYGCVSPLSSSRINADILACGELNGENTVYFAIESSQFGFVPVSVLYSGGTDYTYQQKRYSVLYKDKVNIETKKITVLKPCAHASIHLDEYFEFGESLWSKTKK